MSKKWSDHSEEEQAKVWEAIAKIYEEAGYPEGLKAPESSGEYVNVLMANVSQESVKGPQITGSFAPDKKSLADELTGKFKKALESVTDSKVDVAAKFDVGATFQTITDVNKVMEEGETSITHEKGQVMLVDFWATWCPPCQGPMAHNQKMLEEHGEKWGGKVRIMGLSIDGDVATVKPHVESKGWTAVEQYHIRNGKCTADKEYGISGVPHVALVDTNGKIVFKGHPANRKDLVKDFNDLLEGKEIVDAPKAGGGDGDEEEKADDSASVDAAEAAASVKKFQELSKEHLLKEETKTAAEGMPRAFCVLVVTGKYDVKAKKMSTTMENYHVLVGPQAKIDAMKEILKPFNDQKWKVTLREQAI